METLDIHPDFSNLKARKLPIARTSLAMANGFLSIANLLSQFKHRRLIHAQTIPGPSGNWLTMQIVRAPGHAAVSSRPALIYFHGGAFVLRHTPGHLENAVHYALNAPCDVFLVQYRRAPRHPFPAGFDDCYAALCWVASNAARLGVDRKHIAVGGDSAGGALAATIAQKATQEGTIKICGQLLIYPVTDVRCKSLQSGKYTDVPPFKGASSADIWDAYLGKASLARVPRYVVPMEGKLNKLPITYIEVAQFDMLRDQGLAYARSLQQQGVVTNLNDIANAIHGFDLLAPLSAVSKAALAARVNFLCRAFDLH